MLKSAMSSLYRALIPHVLPAYAGCPGGAGVPARTAAAAGAAVPASGGPASGGTRGAGRGSSGPAARAQGPGPGELVREAVPCRWDDEEITRLRGFLATVDDLRGRQGRVYPLEYLLALLLAAVIAGDGGLDAAAEWAATAPGELLLRLGAPLDRDGKPRRPDAGTIRRGLTGCDQGQYDDVLCAWQGARAGHCGPACAATCGSTARRCAAPLPGAGTRRCCCPGSGTTALPPPSSRWTP